MELAPIERRGWTFVIALSVLTLIGVASLMAMPLEELLPDGIEIPRAALLIQPAILGVGGALLGWWAAPKVGLDAPIIGALTDGSEWKSALRNAIFPAIIVAVVVASVLLIYARLTVGEFPNDAVADPLPLSTRLLYGGISEEVLSRWAILSVLLLGLTKLKLPAIQAFWTANFLAALIFAVGHFGVLFGAVAEPSGFLIAAVVIGNMLPGLLFGWLFARYGLESAMLAHAGGHFVAYLFIG